MTVRVERLAEKYRALGELRRARARGEPVPERAVFRALAGEFPGALHELDNLPLEEIDRRLAVIAQIERGGPVEPWMAWMQAYHALMRAALYMKIRVARAESLSSGEAAALAERASAHAQTDVDADFVVSVKHPPGGGSTGSCSRGSRRLRACRPTRSGTRSSRGGALDDR